MLLLATAIALAALTVQYTNSGSQTSQNYS